MALLRWPNLKRFSGHTLFVTLFLTLIIGSLIGIKVGNVEKTAHTRSKFGSSLVDNGSILQTAGSTPPVCADQGLDAVNIILEVYNVNYPNSQLQVSSSFIPCGEVLSHSLQSLTLKFVGSMNLGAFVSSFDDFDSFIATNMSILVNADTFNFANGAVMSNKTSNIYIEGDANSYPLDTFTVTFNVRGTFGPNNQKLPIIVFLFGAPLGYSLNLNVAGTATNTAASLTVSAKRNPTTIAFALAIMLLMWAMSLLAIALAYSVWTIKKDKKVELPFIIFTVALLFAMPTIRNAMPNAPPIGVLADQMVTGWAMLLLSLSVISHFINLLYHVFKDANAAAATAPPAATAIPMAVMSERKIQEGEKNIVEYNREIGNTGSRRSSDSEPNVVIPARTRSRV
ncbi:hypothetical protein BC830DRAFT_1168238 [Chytriomyces sp. MP71]|nr:hypothetical protein BC830DRAFT_1168238 [Chytriomyces sp. MP71]